MNELQRRRFRQRQFVETMSGIGLLVAVALAFTAAQTAAHWLLKVIP